MKKLFLLFILQFGITSCLFSQPLLLKIRLLQEEMIDTVVIIPLNEDYIMVFSDSSNITMNSNKEYNFIARNSKLEVVYEGVSLGIYTSAHIQCKAIISTFRIKTAKGIDRIYDNDIMISCIEGILKLINHVELENYVAGVVQAEVSGATNLEKFFEIQAIISRTYALNNIMKHYKEGYNLCDGVHCQVYRGRCNKTNVKEATLNTIDKVIVDKDRKMISAAFHSNSGGQTVNSEDIWTISTTYLKSVKDTYSLQMPNYKWVAKVPVNEWLTYLNEKYGYPVNDSAMLAKALHFDQANRNIYFHNDIPLKYIRNDLKLKSTYFTVVTDKGMVYINGKGYGHGVGLSQEGAIRMIQLGFTPYEVIRFYYTDVEVVEYSTLNP